MKADKLPSTHFWRNTQIQKKTITSSPPKFTNSFNNSNCKTLPPGAPNFLCVRKMTRLLPFKDLRNGMKTTEIWRKEDGAVMN